MTSTYRPRVQDLVHPEEQQGYQSRQEHVHKHSANKSKNSKLQLHKSTKKKERRRSQIPPFINLDCKFYVRLFFQKEYAVFSSTNISANSLRVLHQQHNPGCESLCDSFTPPFTGLYM